MTSRHMTGGMFVLAAVLAALFLSGCIHASIGNL
jgi:outer membrane murein-binding lipoprotein Lpp